MGNTFKIVPNELDPDVELDKQVAFPDDKFNIATKNGVIWVHRGGHLSVSSSVTLGEARAAKFTPKRTRKPNSNSLRSTQVSV